MLWIIFVCILILWVSSLLIRPANCGWDSLSSSQILQKISHGIWNFFTVPKRTHNASPSVFHTLHQRLSHNKFAVIRYRIYCSKLYTYCSWMLPCRYDVYPRNNFWAFRMKLFLSFPQLHSVSSVHAWPYLATAILFFCYSSFRCTFDWY